ncbi:MULTISPECIES: Rv3235 family protein [unclassified Streptomyces]|uniref:Rv3235 family protein n=1 Tax=unclassified Streptomyces TaxID=2593676 RepID=UPI00278BB946|nr:MULTISPECIES: Rv3235 family protein [unclassified Streptomyces]
MQNMQNLQNTQNVQKVLSKRDPRRVTTRPPNRRDPRRPTERRRSPQPPPHPTEHFTQLLLLVLGGHRPPHWFARHTADRAYDDLLWLVDRRPLGTTGPRPTVHDIGHCALSAYVYEVFARIAVGPRLHALAFRLHLHSDRRWRVTAVELDGRPPRDTYDTA